MIFESTVMRGENDDVEVDITVIGSRYPAESDTGTPERIEIDVVRIGDSRVEIELSEEERERIEAEMMEVKDAKD